MNIYIRETREIREITLREWTNGQWSPDMFDDLAADFAAGRETLPGDNVLICTADEARELIDWWEDEVRWANSLPADWDQDDDPSYPGDHALWPGEYSLDVTTVETAP